MLHRLMNTHFARTLAMLLVIALGSVGCGTSTPTAADPLPTLIPTSTPSGLNMEGAERVARAFLDAWQLQDLPTMHSLISLSNQAAYPLDDFRDRYQTAHNTLTLESVSYRGNAIQRDDLNPRIAFFNYTVTFNTRLLGEFTDGQPNGRNLRLIYEPALDAWRVAWSPGDIFPEMERGARLRLTTQPVNRANIYDRDGVVLADQEHLIITVNVVKGRVTDLNACTALLTDALVTPDEAIRIRLDNANADWTTEVGELEVNAFETWEQPLIDTCNATFGNRPARRYPNGNLLPHILGSVGYVDPEQVDAVTALGFQPDAILGRSGLELQWDEALRGQPSITLRLESGDGTPLRTIASRPATVAQSLWLTIDATLQQTVLEIMIRAYGNNAEGWAQTSDGGSAVVIDLNTGAILAMVSYPTYDANAFAPFPVIGRNDANDAIDDINEDERRPLLNRPVQAAYPNGSTMKLATAIAAADSGVYELDERYVCTGIWSREENFTRYDWFAPGHGSLTLAGGVTNSCNPYFYEAGYHLYERDPYLLPTYMRMLGLGMPSGLTDIVEVSGFVGDPERLRVVSGRQWTVSDSVNMAIGQGEVAVTPLQVAQVASAIANDGTRYTPHIVQQVGLLGDYSYVAEPTPYEKATVEPAVFAVIREGMCDVTTASTGTAEFVFRPKPDLQALGVCGKTGTAQAFVDGQPAQPHAWFVAYAPRDEPEIAVVVMIENAGEGSGVAAPIAADIMDYYFFGDWR